MLNHTWHDLKQVSYLTKAHKKLIFQQDNAAIHVSGSTRQWFEDHNSELSRDECCGELMASASTPGVSRK